MSLIGLVLWGGYLVVFARFCDVYWRLRPFAAGSLPWSSLLGRFFYRTLLRNNYRQSPAGFVARFVPCFVGFSCRVRIGGLDRLGLGRCLGRDSRAAPGDSVMVCVGFPRGLKPVPFAVRT